MATFLHCSNLYDGDVSSYCFLCLVVAAAAFGQTSDAYKELVRRGYMQDESGVWLTN